MSLPQARCKACIDVIDVYAASRFHVFLISTGMVMFVNRPAGYGNLCSQTRSTWLAWVDAWQLSILPGCYTVHSMFMLLGAQRVGYIVP